MILLVKRMILLSVCMFWTTRDIGWLYLKTGRGRSLYIYLFLSRQMRVRRVALSCVLSIVGSAPQFIYTGFNGFGHYFVYCVQWSQISNGAAQILNVQFTFHTTLSRCPTIWIQNIDLSTANTEIYWQCIKSRFNVKS